MIGTPCGFRRVALAAVAVAVASVVLPASTLAAGRTAPAVAVVIEVPKGLVGQARLATLASVVGMIATPGLKLAVYVDAGPTNGSELLFDNAPPAPRPQFNLPHPKLPADPTPLEREAYAVAVKKWKAGVRAAAISASRAGTSAVAKWASRRSGGLLATPLRSDPARACSDYAATLYRAGLFFAGENHAPRTLVVIGDLVRCRPPSPRLLNYQLTDARVILAGMSAIDPMAYRARNAAWRGFFTAEGTSKPVVLPHGLDTAAAISALVKP